MYKQLKKKYVVKNELDSHPNVVQFNTNNSMATYE